VASLNHDLPLPGNPKNDSLRSDDALEQTRRNGDDLAALKTRFDRLEGKVDGIERKLDNLASNLPQIVGDVMREVVDKKPKKR
jgi:hypothetical protein